MLSADCVTLREAHFQPPWSEPTGSPPLTPIAAGGLSGRPRCRIFPVGRLWVLQLETTSGWLLGDGAGEPPHRLTFPTLAAAVNHAVLHGYDYRIITPSPVACLPDRGLRMARDESQPLYGRSTGRSRTQH